MMTAILIGVGVVIGVGVALLGISTVAVIYFASNPIIR